MAQNDFLVWSGGLNANVLSQINYAGLGNLTSGVVAGKASAQQANKTWRQTSIMSAMIAKFIVDRTNNNVIDDGTINNIETSFINAIASLFVIPNTGVVPGTYGPTMSLTVQADGRVTAVSNAALVGGGVAAGTYIAPTLGISADGRVVSAISVSYGPLNGNNAWTGSNTFSTNNVNFTLDAKGNANGAVMTFVGNGTVTPNKYIRAVNGVMQWMNSTFGAAIASLTDAGTFTAIGRLRAGIGAFGSGDTAAAALLGDWTRVSGGQLSGVGQLTSVVNYNWTRNPSGWYDVTFWFTMHWGGSLNESCAFDTPVGGTILDAFICLGSPGTGAGLVAGSQGMFAVSWSGATINVVNNFVDGDITSGTIGPLGMVVRARVV